MPMDKFFGTLLSTSGRAVPGAAVTVLLSGTATLASLFADDETTALPNPLTTDSLGSYAFCARDGVYDLSILNNGITTTVSKIVLFGQILGGQMSSAQWTRPNDSISYTAGDVYGTIAATYLTFANIGEKLGASLIITDASLRIDVNVVPTGMDYFRLHLYNLPPAAIADNVLFSLAAGDRAAYQGYVDIPLPFVVGSSIFSRIDSVNMLIKLDPASTSLYGILQSAGGFPVVPLLVNTVTVGALNI